MDEGWAEKRAYLGQTTGRRLENRSKYHWTDEVTNDLKELNARKWSELVLDENKSRRRSRFTSPRWAREVSKIPSSGPYTMRAVPQPLKLEPISKTFLWARDIEIKIFLYRA